MSTSEPDFDSNDLRNDIGDVMAGNVADKKARNVYEGLTTAWGLPEVVVGKNGERGVPTSALKRKVLENPEWLEERYGTRHPFLAAAIVKNDSKRAAADASPQTRDAIATLNERATADPDSERAVVDESVIGDAAPVEVDPVIVDVQRQAAPELEVIQSVAQPGFSFQYNVLSNRDDPVGFLSEGEAEGDLESQFSNQSFTLSDETLSHTRHVGLVKISDFSQRAMETLEYMDPRETTLGQATIAHTLQKAKGLFYGDPSQAAADQSIEDGDAFRGLAKIASLAGNTTSKSTVSSGFMEDLLDELTDKVQNSGLTWDRARFFVSPEFYNAVYDEVTPVVRLDGYDADVEYGPQGIALSSEMGSVPITPAPNIRNYSGLTGVGSNSDNGDVFLVDEMALQFRQLAPLSTVPLGRTGLADRVALFEYYTLVDKSFDSTNSISHTEWYQSYDI